MKMLLMVPFDVIDSVPAIREYLDTGSTENSQKKLQQELDENIARSKSIVDASVDAIIITDNKVLKITVLALIQLRDLSKYLIRPLNLCLAMTQEKSLERAFILLFLLKIKTWFFLRSWNKSIQPSLQLNPRKWLLRRKMDLHFLCIYR